MKLTGLKRRLLATSVSGLLLGAVLLIYGFSYAINDDTAMVSILNGSYSGTPDGHAIFVKYPLAWVIKTLYCITNSVAWYVVVMMLIYWLAMGFLLCQFYARFPEHPFLVTALFGSGMSLLWINQISHFTFSTCGAFVSASAILSYALIPREEDLKVGKLGPLLLLLWLSYCVRDYFALATLLFLAIIWLSKYYDRMFKEAKCWLLPAIGVAGLLLCVGCHAIAFSSPEWQEFMSYNDHRSYVQDYAGLPSYDKHQDFYQEMGYSKRERKCVSAYHYLLLEEFSPDDFEHIYEYVKEHEKKPSLVKTAKKALKSTFKHYFLFDKEDIRPLQVVSLAAPAALLLLSVLFSIRDKKHYWVFSLMVLFGLGCMWLYISYNGRYPSRVASSLRIITTAGSMAGLAMLFTARPVKGLEWWKKGAGCRLLVGLSLVGVLLGGMLCWQEIGHSTSSDRAWFYAYADAHPEALFLRDTSLSFGASDDSPSVNSISTGGWLHYSPLYQQKLTSMGRTEISRATLLEPDVYLITFADTNLRKLMGIGDKTKLVYETVAQENGICIYKFTTIGKRTAND